MKITAEYARELSGPTIEEGVDSIYSLIHAAAVKNRRYVCLREGKNSAEWREAARLLKEDGFKVDFIYCNHEEKYTIVSW